MRNMHMTDPPPKIRGRVLFKFNFSFYLTFHMLLNFTAFFIYLIHEVNIVKKTLSTLPILSHCHHNYFFSFLFSSSVSPPPSPLSTYFFFFLIFDFFFILIFYYFFCCCCCYYFFFFLSFFFYCCYCFLLTFCSTHVSVHILS